MFRTLAIALDVISAQDCVPHKLSLTLFVRFIPDLRANGGFRSVSASENGWMASLAVAQALQDLFIYLQWPRGQQAEETPAARHAADLERAVMGPEYDAEARGKWVDLPRLWYDGESREGPVFAADSTQIWPRRRHQAAREAPIEVPYTYV